MIQIDDQINSIQANIKTVFIIEIHDKCKTDLGVALFLQQLFYGFHCGYTFIDEYNFISGTGTFVQ